MRIARGYHAAYLGKDLVAGLIVAALAIPQSLGYATVAGVPVQVGLYTMPPALLAYALFGSSRLLFMGPVSTVTVLSGSIVGQLAGGDPELAVTYTAALSMCAGVVLMVTGLLRLGWVAQFLSMPIITGFVAGLVVLIVVGEIPGLLGLETPSGNLFSRSATLVQAVPLAHGITAVVSGVSLVVLFAGSKLAPKVPWALVVLIGAILYSREVDLAGQGVRVVGEIPSGIPTPGLHWPGMEHLSTLITGGIAIAGVGIAEGLAAARTFAGSSPNEHLDDDSELVANGVADLASGVFGGMGVAGSLSKTAANARAGARTQVSGLAAALTVLAVLLVAAPALAPLPRAVLAAIVIHAVVGLVKPHLFPHYFRIRLNDGISAVMAFGGVLVLGPLYGLVLAIVQAIAGLVYRSMQVSIDEMGKVSGEKAAWGSVDNDPSRRLVKGVCVLRPDGPMFWANAAAVMKALRSRAETRETTRAVVLDLEATNQLDVTTADGLLALMRALRGEGVELYLVRVFGDVRRVLERSEFLTELGEDRVWHSISAGVKAARADIRARSAVEEAGLDLDEDLDVLDAEGGDEGERIVARPSSSQPIDVMSLVKRWSNRNRERATMVPHEPLMGWYAASVMDAETGKADRGDDD